MWAPQTKPQWKRLITWAPLKYLSDARSKLHHVYTQPSTDLCTICFQFRKHNRHCVGWGATVTVCFWFRRRRIFWFLSGFWQWVGGSQSHDRLMDGCSYLNFPFYYFLFPFDLWFHDCALFCFFILVNIMNVYILCFDHLILFFQFVHTLYASASYLRLF